MTSAIIRAREAPIPRQFVDALDYLHEQARVLTGFTDFGDDSYLVGLRVLLESLDESRQADDGLREAALRQVGLPLKGRLHLQHGWAQSPGVLAAPTPRPLVIIGAPRSGTTALHKLLAMDTDFQGLESWLARQPMVRPPRESWGNHPVYRRELRDYEAYMAAMPEMRAIHDVRPDEVDECILPISQSYASNMFGSTLNVPAYDAWYRQQDQAPIYRRHADLLRLVGASSDKRWLLKNPSHVLSLDALLDAFPDAKVVHIHRDPIKTVPSAASLLSILARRFEGDATDLVRIGRREFDLWRTGLSRALDVAAAHPDRILAVREAELLADPVALVARIYDFAGLAFRPAAEAAMADWIRANPKGKHGNHSYTPEQFGLSEGLLREGFHDYRQRMGFA